MARTYDPSLLAEPDVTSIDWALTWVRFTLRDTNSTSGEYSDAEIIGALKVNSVVSSDGVTLYRPHLVAAQFVQSDPHRVISLRADDVAETFASPRDIAGAILRSGAAIDRLVVAAGGPSRRPVARVLF